ncbi:hypothetical protein MOE20_10135 [Bacillus atrophaeus]|uniref:hypothetical protein n=1 Tax=Bacillus atrophaeus TaxID=1452 RepID=UPI0022805AE7|nr:hypothetical protein [Bacillus atrophaeus]MCY8917393.1 hypothetical protein [Bacillus atrophaeus]MCY8924975.1 hypothetical protein [Bacillus atrophaeus]
MRFNVEFEFSNGNYRDAIIEAKSEEILIKEIKECADWYEYTKNKVTYNINIHSVTSFSVKAK